MADDRFYTSPTINGAKFRIDNYQLAYAKNLLKRLAWKALKKSGGGNINYSFDSVL